MVDSSPDRRLLTGRLRQWGGGGDKQALDQLMPLVYDHLRKLASRSLSSERSDHTLATTALVHEAYLGLVDADVAWQDRIHFFAVSARILRHVLVDRAKAHNHEKRGDGAYKVELDKVVGVGPQSSARVLELDEALRRLTAHDSRKGEIVELLCFACLTYHETAVVLKISSATVHRDLTMAKAWLHRQLTRSA